MAKYAELDALILAHIRNGRDTFGSLTRGETGAMAYKAGYPSGVDRTIDRRLQSLRKRGLIRFGGGRWHLARPATGHKKEFSNG